MTRLNNKAARIAFRLDQLVKARKALETAEAILIDIQGERGAIAFNRTWDAHVIVRDLIASAPFDMVTETDTICPQCSAAYSDHPEGQEAKCREEFEGNSVNGTSCPDCGVEGENHDWDAHEALNQIAVNLISGN